MLLILLFGFLLFYPVHQVLGFVWVVGLAGLIVATKLVRRQRLVLSWKDGLFFLYALLASFAALAEPRGSLFFARLVLYPWMISFACQNIAYTESRLRWAFWAMTLTALAVAAVMLFQEEPGKFNFSLEYLLTVNRNAGFYFTGPERIGPNAAAAMSAGAIVLLLADIKFDSRAPVPAYALLGCASLFLFIAGGRNALVATAMCVAIFLLYPASTAQRKGAKQVVRVGLVVLVLATVTFVAFQVLQESQGERLVQRLQGLLRPSEDHNVNVRLLHWARALAMFREQPMGWGFNAYFERYYYTTHNELLGQLVAVGVIATLAYFALIGFVWVYVLRMPVLSGPMGRVRFATICFLLIFTLGMVTENISRGTMNTFSPLLWVLVGMSISVTHHATRDTKDETISAQDGIVVRGM